MTVPDYLPDLFSDPLRADGNLIQIHEAFIRSGSRFPIDQFADAIRTQLLASPDPGMALTNLIRFSEASVSKAALFNDLVQYPVILDLLMRLFGSSQYFSDILVREPGLFSWLTTTDALVVPLSSGSLTTELARLRRTFERPERRIEPLKRIHRREMLRIGAQDLLGSADLASVTRQLSDLADGIVGEVC